MRRVRVVTKEQGCFLFDLYLAAPAIGITARSFPTTMPYTQQDLDLAQCHVDQAEQRLRHQQYLVNQLCRAGHDASAAEELLRILERTHQDLIELRNKIAEGLAAAEL